MSFLKEGDSVILSKSLHLLSFHVLTHKMGGTPGSLRGCCGKLKQLQGGEGCADV